MAAGAAGGTRRWGITVPLDTVPLAQHADWYRELADLGYTDAWSAESNGTDGLTPLAAAAVAAPSLRLGTAILPAYLRGPALLAQSVASLAELAPGRVAIGVGTSSNVIVERWNGLTFDRPYQRVRDTVRFLRTALTGVKVTEKYETFQVNGFRLGRPLPAEAIPPILVAALRPGMLRLAGREGDGAVINWLSAEDVRTVVPYVHEGGPDKEIAARIFVCPSSDTEKVRAIGKMAIAAYLNVPVYAAFHDWLGRGEQLAGMWSSWQAGDRKAALAAVPDSLVDELIVHGPPEACVEHLERYVDAGVTTPVIALMAPEGDLHDTIRGLAPR
jgi:probable F420-dependent oxidoreductase